MSAEPANTISPSGMGEKNPKILNITLPSVRKEHEILEHKFAAFVLEFQEEKEQIYRVIKKTSDSIND